MTARRRNFLGLTLVMLSLVGLFSIAALPAAGDESTPPNATAKEGGKAKKAAALKEAPTKDSSSKETASKDTSPKEKGDRSGVKGKAPAKPQVPGYTNEREAAAMTFVRMHHAELADLLDQLKTNDRAEYRKAIVELFAASERLAQIQENNPARYDLELQLWKLTSRIHVLAVRLSMASDPETQQELRQVLADELQVREQLVQMDRDKAANRLANLDRQLEQLRFNQEQQIEQRYDRVLKNAQTGLSPAAINPTTKPSTAKP